MKHYRLPKTNRSLLSLTSILAATFVLAGGISYASLVSQPAVLKSNLIQTGTANLQVSADGTTFSNSLSGYAFGGLIPGGQAMPTNGNPIYLKNAGNTALIGSLSIPAGFSNPNNLDLTKAHLILSPMGGGAAQNYTLQALVDGASTGGVQLSGTLGDVPIGGVVSYTMKIQLDADAVNGPSATLSNLEFDFGGTATN